MEISKFSHSSCLSLLKDPFILQNQPLKVQNEQNSKNTSELGWQFERLNLNHCIIKNSACTMVSKNSFPLYAKSILKPLRQQRKSKPRLSPISEFNSSNQNIKMINLTVSEPFYAISSQTQFEQQQPNANNSHLLNKQLFICSHPSILDFNNDTSFDIRRGNEFNKNNSLEKNCSESKKLKFSNFGYTCGASLNICHMPEFNENNIMIDKKEAISSCINYAKSSFTKTKTEEKEKEEQKPSLIKKCSSRAFKFFMEQHIENIVKYYEQRNLRALQLEKEMAKINLPEHLQAQMRLMLNQKESNYIRLKRVKMAKSMFVKIKLIGAGAFGEVSLVRRKDSLNKLYAMKTLRKVDVLKKNQAAHVKAERDILAEADNEWVVKLYYSFQDKDNLYFVMAYIPGGDLMSLLIRKGVFEESLARFYIAEITCAVDSVHRMGFIHRDIKPDNILIDRDGHIKLADFGLCTGFRWTHNSKFCQENGGRHSQSYMEARNSSLEGAKLTVSEPRRILKNLKNRRTVAHSLVGTPNYMAPEVLECSGYTKLCDWWSVGIILYEMLVGRPPFSANNFMETKQKVINWKKTLVIPPQAQLSEEASDLILQLCSSADKRLGKTTEEVQIHSFFKRVNWINIRKEKAPYIPKIQYSTDISNFDTIQEKLNLSTDFIDNQIDNNYDNFVHGFFEFTFRRFFDCDI